MSDKYAAALDVDEDRQCEIDARRVEALETNVRELTLAVLSMGGTERAWHVAMLGLLEAIGGAPEVADKVSEQLETTRRGMVDSGVAQAHIQSFCAAGSLILATIRAEASSEEGNASVH